MTDSLESEVATAVVDAHRMGILPTDTVLFHTSFKSLGTALTPLQWVEVLVEKVLPEGTAVFPTLTGSEACAPASPPPFDAQRTPPWTGAVPAASLAHPRAVRSLSLTHSVTAIGTRAEALCRDHALSETPCGAGSPYDKLAKGHGRILLVGCGMQSCTMLHYVEELAEVDYHMLPGHSVSQATDWSGVIQEVRQRYHRYGIPRDFAKLEEPLLQAGAMKIGRILQAECRLIDASAMTLIALELVRANPAFLLA